MPGESAGADPTPEDELRVERFRETAEFVTSIAATRI